MTVPIFSPEYISHSVWVRIPNIHFRKSYTFFKFSLKIIPTLINQAFSLHSIAGNILGQSVYLIKNLLYHNTLLCYFTVCEVFFFFFKALVHFHEDSKGLVLYLDVSWRVTFQAHQWMTARTRSGLHLTSFLATGPKTFLLSSAYVPMFTHMMGLWRVWSMVHPQSHIRQGLDI